LGTASLPVVNDISGMLNGDEPPADPVTDPDTGAVEGDAGGGTTGGSLLQRLFSEGPGGFDLMAIGSTVTDPEAIRQLFDNLDAVPGNVTVTHNGDETVYDIAVHKTLSGASGFALSLLRDSFHLKGDVNVSAAVDLHLVAGVDRQGFFLDVSGGPLIKVS